MPGPTLCGLYLMLLMGGSGDADTKPRPAYAGGDSDIVEGMQPSLRRGLTESAEKPNGLCT